jgi:hypothetical protein
MHAGDDVIDQHQGANGVAWAVTSRHPCGLFRTGVITQFCAPVQDHRHWRHCRLQLRVDQEFLAVVADLHSGASGKLKRRYLHYYSARGATLKAPSDPTCRHT